MAEPTNLTPVLDFARVCMLRDRVVIDFDSIGSLDPVQRCMLVARVINTTVVADAEMRGRFIRDGLMNRLRDEAIQRQSSQSTEEV